jgi:Zn-dependent protease with chaperone function
MQSYRYPYEQLVLGLTLVVIAAVTLIFAGPTLCVLPLLMALFVLLSYRMTRLQHQQLLSQGEPVGNDHHPNLAVLAGECMQRLQVRGVELFVVPSRQLNAYTFGLSNPKTVVLFSALFQTMDADEIRFVIGHELGHVALDHAWLNTLIGGMGGVPMPFEAAVVLTLAFRWWNRMCEYSADRAGLLACANPQKAVSALIKLFSGSVASPAELERALALIEQEDDSFLNVLAETFSTHPMLVRRIRQVREYAATPEYRRLQAEVMRRAG